MAMPHERKKQIDSVLHQVESNLDRDISELYSIRCETDVVPAVENCSLRAEQSRHAMENVLK